MIALYRTRPHEVSADRVPTKSMPDDEYLVAHGHIAGWFMACQFTDWMLGDDNGEGHTYEILTPYGWEYADPGDYIVRDGKVFRRYSPQRFEREFERCVEYD